MDGPNSPQPPGSPGPSTRQAWAFGLLMMAIFWALHSGLISWASNELSYSDFKTHLADGKIQSCRISAEEISGELKPAKEGQKGARFYTLRVEDPGLVAALEAQKVEYRGSPSRFGGIFQLLVPMLLVFLFLAFLSRLNPSGVSSYSGISGNRARLVAENEVQVNFAQIAGCEEAKGELQEIVDFLKDPSRYQRMGAHIPKGVLLLGPPGTGKTLMARAVAGEAKVPFYSISGSDFVEMFVGVGASRVRGLFEQAKAHAPCIVFIDELDAVGRERGVRVGYSNDEREQTLNQLLVEMDGFKPNSGVILLAATNRPEILDRALLRPGRFDRRVVLDLPDLEGRLAILRVHSLGKPLAPAVNLLEIARGTPGLSGADLANAINEAALRAVRRDNPVIEQSDLEQAVEKVMAGPERRSRRISPQERARIAYHEAGHALVAWHSPGADPVRKVSIVPRGSAALGYTIQLPREEHSLATEGELEARIRVLLAGRAAEKLVFDETSTGAENDLERATALARHMVCLFGMSQALGLGQSSRRDGSFLQPDGAFVRDCSEETASLVDREVRDLLDRLSQEATTTLIRQRTQLERLALQLLEEETLEGEELTGILSADIDRSPSAA